MTEDLRTIIAEIRPPEMGRLGEMRYRVRKISGTDHYIGRDSNGSPCLLLESVESGSRSPIRLAALEVQFALLCRITEEQGQESTQTLTAITCRSSDEALTSYFAHVAQTIVGILGRRPRSFEVAEAVRRLAELFQSLNRATGRSVLGLFGELFVIHLSRSPQQALSAWRSSTDNRFDFSIDNVRLEAKSSSDRVRAHHFSREQCMPPEGTVGILISMFVERSGGGLSLGDLVQRIEGQVTGNPELILRLHSTVVETLGDATTTGMSVRFDEHLARASVRTYDLSHIPAVREDIPPEVSQVHFRADISGLNPVSASALITRSARVRDLLPPDV